MIRNSMVLKAIRTISADQKNLRIFFLLIAINYNLDQNNNAVNFCWF